MVGLGVGRTCSALVRDRSVEVVEVAEVVGIAEAVEVVAVAEHCTFADDTRMA
jgi:hypothetical protein